MKSYYCKRLYEEINFDAENVYVCCGKSLGPEFSSPSILKSESNKSFSCIKEYCTKLNKWKYNVAKDAYLGKISEKCKNCIELKTREITLKDYLRVKLLPERFCNEFKIKNIIVKSYRQCELSCLYYLERKYTKGQTTPVMCKSEFYDLFPIINSLISENMLDNKNLRIEFQGGSISVWDEFLPILNQVVDCGVGSLYYHTNAITYISEISDVAAKIPSGMSISIDSGCKETYQKIKGKDLFDNVIDNIIKYANSGIKISIKYIIVKNLNDKLEEMIKFLNVVKNIRNQVNNKDNICIMIDVDFRESLAIKNYVIPNEYRPLIEHSIEFCKENNIYVDFQEYIKKQL